MINKGKGGINQDLGININTLLYIKYIIIKDLLYSTGIYTQYFVTTYKIKESKKEYLYIYIKNIQPYICESLCGIPESNTTLYINYMSIKIYTYMGIVLKKRSELAKSLQT